MITFFLTLLHGIVGHILASIKKRRKGISFYIVIFVTPEEAHT